MCQSSALTAPTQAMAKAINENNIGCRVGTNIQGAAYALSDICAEGTRPSIIECIKRRNKWASKPQCYEPLWSNRLWNTCAFILSLAPAGGTILIVTRAAPTAERYKNSWNPYDDGYTFAKANKLPQNSETIATFTFTGRECPGELYRMIYDAIKNWVEKQ